LPEALNAVFALAHDALGGDDGRWYGWLRHIEALRREWDENQILARAREFSYEPFKRKLALQLAS
jgi:hypothetical protein